MKAQSNLANLADLLERSCKRTQSSQQRVLSIINSLIGVIQKAEQDLTYLQNPNSGMVRSRLEKLHSSIAQLKPLANQSTLHQEMYARLSKIRKEIDKSFNSANIKTRKGYFGEFNRDLLEIAIIQHFLRENNLEATAIMKSSYIRQEIFQKGIAMYGEVMAGNFTAAIEWAEGEKLYETFGIEIEFELRKREFLKFAENNQVTQAISYCRNYLAKFVNRKMKSIQQIMGFLFFSDSDVTFAERYKKFKLLLGNYQDIARQFLKVYHVHYNISQFDSLQLCLRAGMRGQSQFYQYQKTFGQHKDALPFSIEMPQFRYHSMFVCPVSKQVSGSNDKPVVLRCGHVVSEYSFNRIVDNRTKPKFKCPVCHTEQKLTEVVEMVF